MCSRVIFWPLLLFVFECNVVVFCIAVETSADHTITNRKVYRKNTTTVNDNNYSTTGDCAIDRRGNLTAEMLNGQLFPMSSKRQREKQMVLTSFPEYFDVREKFGARCPGIKRVYNQGQCKSGWAIAIASVISDRVCINSGGKKPIMLSAQNLLSCCLECCGCNGGIILNAWDWVISNGLVTGSVYKDKKSCMPYKIPPAHPNKYNYPGFGGEWAIANLAVQDCSNTCKDGTTRIITNIVGYELWSKKDQYYLMEQLMKYGPLQVSMHIYEDFRYYKEGIYVHQIGKFEGEHAVKLIGWGTWKSTQYWLAMNSFGNTSWGMNGTFMVPRNGKDNTEFGYAIISPILTENRAASGIHIYKLKMLIICLIIFYF